MGGFSTEFLEWLFHWTTIIAAVFGGLGLIAALFSAFSGYEVSDRLQKESNEKISKANARAEEANERTEKLRADNLALQAAIQPRRLSSLIAVTSPDEPDSPPQAEIQFSGIRTFAGTPVLIQSVPDFEAQILARDIFFVVQAFGWKPQFVDQAASHLSPLTMHPGVEVTYTRDGKYRDAAMSLVIGFAKAGLTGPGIIENAVGGPTGVAQGLPVDHDGKPVDVPGYPRFDPKIEAVIVLVGMRPMDAKLLTTK